jgi:hypothetical protein
MMFPSPRKARGGVRAADGGVMRCWIIVAYDPSVAV